MNKFFTRIVGAALGLAMAIGVGVAASSISKENHAFYSAAVSGSGTGSLSFGSTHKVAESGDTLNDSQNATWNFTTDSTYVALDGGAIHTGSGKATCSHQTWSSSDYSGVKITSVVINAKMAASSGVSLSATINGSNIENAKTLTDSAADYTFTNSNTFIGGDLEISAYRSSATKKAIYIYTITVNYEAFTTQTISGDSEAFVGQTVTLTSNAPSPTWSIVTADTTAPGAAITSAGVVSTTGAGSVKVKATKAGYTEATHTITFNNRPSVTNVALDTDTAEIGFGDTFDYNAVGVTVTPSAAIQTVSWSVSANTVSNDFTFNASGLRAGDTEGTVTLRCESTTDSSKYDEIVVTISGTVTFAFASDSFNGFVGKDSDITFTYTNVPNSDVENFDFVSSDDSIVEITGSIDAEDGSGSIPVHFKNEGDATISVSYDGGETLDTIDVSVVVDTVKSVNWSASNIDVFSGDTLTSAIDSTWLVNYEMESGDVGNLTYGQYTLKLDTNTITLPHTWSAEDSGKTLSVEYGNVSSSSVSVTVTQSVSGIMKESYASRSSNMTFTEACGGSGTGTGDISSNWTITSDAAESNYDATKGIHYGTGSAAVEYIQLVSDSFSSGTITEVVVNASGASGVTGSVSVTVGGNPFDTTKSFDQTAGNKTFTDRASAGQIVVRIYKDSAATKAIYCKTVNVTYEVSNGETNIANNASHKAAQRVAVKYAKAFNTAMDTTAYCTTNMDTAWATCSSAYNTFKSEAAALGETEEAWAKDLIKYATAKYTEDSDSDYTYCIERMMETYKRCVKNHGKTAFMSELVSLSGANTVLLPFGSDSNSSMVLIIVITISSVALVGGFIFFKKRRLH